MPPGNETSDEASWPGMRLAGPGVRLAGLGVRLAGLGVRLAGLRTRLAGERTVCNPFTFTIPELLHSTDFATFY